MDVRIGALIVIIVSVSLTFGVQTASAERVIDFQKVVDVEKKSLEHYFADINSLQRIFPQNIKQIHQIDSENEKIFRIDLKMNGLTLKPSVLYEKSENTHSLKILDGDLKGTTIDTNLKKTWGFDGSPNKGTIVNVQTNLKTYGLFSLINLIPEKAIHYTFDYTLLRITSDFNGESVDIPDEQQSIKKGKRSR